MLDWLSQPHKMVIDQQISRITMRYHSVKSNISFKTTKLGIDWVYQFQQINYQFESKLVNNLYGNCLDLDTFEVIVVGHLNEIDGKWKMPMSTLVIVLIGQVVGYLGRILSFLVFALVARFIGWKFIISVILTRYIYYFVAESILLLLVNIKLSSKSIKVKQVDKMLLKVNLGTDSFFAALIKDTNDGKFRAKSVSGLSEGVYVYLQVFVSVWTLDVENLILDVARFRPPSFAYWNWPHFQLELASVAELIPTNWKNLGTRPRNFQ